MGAADQRSHTVASRCCACYAHSFPLHPRRFPRQWLPQLWRFAEIDLCASRALQPAAAFDVAATVSGRPPLQVGRHLVSAPGVLQSLIAPSDTCD